MKRATHYGVAADKQEVEYLRSEVSRLRTHITDMGNKIGQLTSLVEALAVDRKSPSAATADDIVAAASAHAGTSCGANAGSGVGISTGGTCSYDSFVFGRVGGGGGSGSDVFEDDKFSHPVGLSASAALPVQAISSSRKRKLVGLGGVLDGSGGECLEGLNEDCDVSDGGGGDVDGDVAMPWPAGAGGDVKPEVMDEGTGCCSYLSCSGTNKGPWAQGLVTVKQEMIDARACRPPWPGSCSPPSLAATSGGGDSSGSDGNLSGLTPHSDMGVGTAAAAAASASPACSLMPPPSEMLIGLDHHPPELGSNGASGGGGDFTLYRTDSGGFSDQFLSFGSPTSPTASYTFPDRCRGCSMASSAGNSGSGSRCDSVAGDIANNVGGGDNGGCDVEGNTARTNVTIAGDGSSSSSGYTKGGVSGCNNRSQGERSNGDTSERGAGDSCSAQGRGAEEETGINCCGDGILSMSLVNDDVTTRPDKSLSSPMTLQPAVAAMGTGTGASHIDDLQNNLESLPAESRMKVPLIFIMNFPVA